MLLYCLDQHKSCHHTEWTEAKNDKKIVWGSSSTTKYYCQFGCGIFKMVGSKMQGFCPRINMLKGVLFKKILVNMIMTLKWLLLLTRFCLKFNFFSSRSTSRINCLLLLRNLIWRLSRCILANSWNEIKVSLGFLRFLSLLLYSNEHFLFRFQPRRHIAMAGSRQGSLAKPL